MVLVDKARGQGQLRLSVSRPPNLPLQRTRKKRGPLSFSLGDRRMLTMSRVATALIFLVSAAIVGLIVTALFVPAEDISKETYKALLQLVVIGAAGHVTSLLITKANNERQDLLRLNELRKALLDRLNASFVQVKKVRRLARATGEKRMFGNDIKYFIDKERFHTYTQALNETQLDLELVSKEIGTQINLFENPNQLIENVNSMEEYLNRIIDEYEHNIISESPDVPGTVSVNDFVMLADLLGGYKTSVFRIDFVHKYYASLDIIRNDLSRLKET
jgi:hypothetical protein